MGSPERDDSEVRVREGYNGQNVVGLIDGSWGKRLVRNISLFFRPPEKGEEYTKTKAEVREALKRIYGEELGDKVFRANIGHMEGGTHVSSQYHPITGRHIRKMMEQGDRELLEKYAEPENGGVRLGRETAGPNAPGATRDWMNEKFFPEGQPEEVRIELRSSNIEVKDRRGRDPYGNVSEALFDDLKTRPQTGEDKLFWTLDVGQGQNTHPIGIHIDMDEPDIVHVYDGNVRQVSVPREELAVWLAAHIKTQYGTDRMELYRSVPMLNSCFERKDETWKRERERTFEGNEIGHWLRQNIKLMDLESIDEHSTCGKFNSDVDRMSFRVLTSGRSHILRSGNSQEVLESLVGGGTKEQTRRAVYNLSVLLNQNLANSPSDLIAKAFVTEIARMRGERTLDFGLMPNGNSSPANITISKQGAKIHIEFEIVQPIKMVSTPETSLLEEKSSFVRARYSIDAPLEALRRDEGYNEFVTSKMDTSLTLVPDLDNLNQRTYAIAMFAKGDGFVSDRVLGCEDIEEALNRGPNDQPGTIEGDLPEELTSEGLTELRRLLGPQTGGRIYDMFWQKATKQDPPGEAPQGRTTVTPKLTRDGTHVLDIEYRFPVPENLPNVQLFHGGEYPSAPGNLELVVAIRVPVEDLDNPPHTYDFLVPPQLEWTPDSV